MTREKLIMKYSKAVRRIGYSRFDTLPEKVKDLLKKETSLEKKVVLMERIADRYSCIPPFKVVRVDWEVDDEKDLDYLPKRALKPLALAMWIQRRQKLKERRTRNADLSV